MVELLVLPRMAIICLISLIGCVNVHANNPGTAHMILTVQLSEGNFNLVSPGLPTPPESKDPESNFEGAHLVFVPGSPIQKYEVNSEQSTVAVENEAERKVKITWVLTLLDQDDATDEIVANALRSDFPNLAALIDGREEGRKKFQGDDGTLIVNNFFKRVLPSPKGKQWNNQAFEEGDIEGPVIVPGPIPIEDGRADGNEKPADGNVQSPTVMVVRVEMTIAGLDITGWNSLERFERALQDLVRDQCDPPCTTTTVKRTSMGYILDSKVRPSGSDQYEADQEQGPQRRLLNGNEPATKSDIDTVLSRVNELRGLYGMYGLYGLYGLFSVYYMLEEIKKLRSASAGV